MVARFKLFAMAAVMVALMTAPLVGATEARAESARETLRNLKFSFPKRSAYDDAYRRYRPYKYRGYGYPSFYYSGIYPRGFFKKTYTPRYYGFEYSRPRLHGNRRYYKPKYRN